MSPPVRLRPATAGDAAFLAAMLAEAAAWRPDEEPRPVGEVAADPALGRHGFDEIARTGGAVTMLARLDPA